MKKLIIIAGITGSIGQELARKYISEKDTLAIWHLKKRSIYGFIRGASYSSCYIKC
jgi:FlaA1/EpsC-like NDP-sugar epimerase